MTTVSYNADNPFAVAVSVAGGRKAGQASHVGCHQPESFDWRLRDDTPHLMKSVTDARFAEVLALLNQVV